MLRRDRDMDLRMSKILETETRSASNIGKDYFTTTLIILHKYKILSEITFYSFQGVQSGQNTCKLKIKLNCSLTNRKSYFRNCLYFIAYTYLNNFTVVSLSATSVSKLQERHTDSSNFYYIN